VGDQVTLDMTCAVISDAADEDIDELRRWAAEQRSDASSVPADSAPASRYTKKAALVAAKLDVDLDAVLQDFQGERLREADVVAYAEQRSKAAARDLVYDAYPAGAPERLLIIGGGDGAVMALDVIESTAHQRAVAIVDDDRDLHGRMLMGVSVMGGVDMAVAMHGDGAFDRAIVSVTSNLAFRARVFSELRDAGVPFANVIAPNVSVHRNVQMGEGNLILSFARLGAATIIGDDNVLSAYVNLEHHNLLGDHTVFGPMVSTSGRVSIGSRVSFGTGVGVEPHVSIGDDCRIASGSIITADVADGTMVKAHQKL